YNLNERSGAAGPLITRRARESNVGFLPPRAGQRIDAGLRWQFPSVVGSRSITCHKAVSEIAKQCQGLVMPKLDRHGVKLHYEVHGTGPALLLTHGYSSTSAMWKGQ